MKRMIFIGCLLMANAVYSQQIFHNLNSFLQYADTKSISLQSNNTQEQKAKKARLAALVSVADPLQTNNASFTDNTKLPVTILPGDAFGGPAGTSKQIKLGTQYNTTIQNTLDIKLLNMEGWKNLKLSKINLELTETDSKLNKKSLYENIAAAYYNIIQLQEQLKSTQKSIAVSDSLLQIVQNKYASGQVKQQDVNDSKVNLLNIQENEKQIGYLINQNYLSLKILADIPDSESVLLDEKMDGSLPIKPEVEKNNLSSAVYKLKEQYALQDYIRTKTTFLPTLSFVANQSLNQYNQNFTIAGGSWISSNYVGLKLSLPLPTSKTITNKVNAQFDYQLAKQSANQAAIKEELEHQKLNIDWEKAQSQVKTNFEILNLQKDTYGKNKNLYAEGLQSIDRTLNSLNTLINADYNLISSKVSVLLAQAKIDINNQIK